LGNKYWLVNQSVYRHKTDQFVILEIYVLGVAAFVIAVMIYWFVLSGFIYYHPVQISSGCFSSLRSTYGNAGSNKKYNPLSGWEE
jgi:hypothetical protein